jgi:GTPase SAR1 family protein
MSIDRNLLGQVTQKINRDQDGIVSLLRGIHRLPDLRDWVTFETVALPPIPVTRLGEWGLVSLLTIPKKGIDGTDGYSTPWAVVEWSLTTMQVVKRVDLRSIKANDPLWMPKVIIDRPADASVSLTISSRTLRENALFTSLDEFCSSPSRSETNFLELAKHYSGTIAKEFYPYYHDLVPESKIWLLVDVPAITLKSIKSDLKEKTVSSVEMAKFDQPKIPAKLPSDLTNKLTDWLKQCTDLSSFLAVENQEIGGQLSASLRNINKRQLMPGFRLAFIGEFSRGKSHLINRLLDRNILPEGTLPTTATLTSIIAGSEEQMEVRIGDEIEVRSLAEASWEDLLATDFAGSDQEVFAGVRIIINCEWLQSLDVEIIDTPGAGDLNDKRANLVLDLLSQCDAAVLLVSATSPFSMTETAFLEQAVIGRHVPRVIVAVSKLDTIAADRRSKLIQNISLKIAKISENIPVLATYPVEESSSETTALFNIMNQIECLVDQGERRIWRSRQVSEQINDWLDQLIEVAQGFILSIQMSSEEHKHYLRNTQIQIEKADIDWGDLQLELDRKRLQRAKEIRQRILSVQEELLENLRFEIKKSTDLKAWWESDLPFRLRRELTVVSRNVENQLLRFLAEDIDWLQQHLESIFATKIRYQSSHTQPDQSIQFALNDREITDIQKYRLLTRLGSTAAMIGGSIMGGPIGIAASTGVLIMSEQYLNQELDKQREVLMGDLKYAIDTSIDRYCHEIGDRLRQLYQSIANDINDEHASWKSAKKVAMNSNIANHDSQENWQQLVQQSLDLKQEISIALSIQ